MANVINHQENANSNHKDMLLHTRKKKKVNYPKDNKAQVLAEDVEKRESHALLAGL